MVGMEAADVSLGALYGAALRELRDEAVQELDPDFYRAASEYLGRLRHEEYDKVEAAVKRAAVSRAEIMLSLLLEVRLEKASGRRGRLDAAAAAAARSHLLDEEKYILYPDTDLDERRALVLDGVLAGRTRLLESVTAAHKSRLVLIRMLAPADEMIGADMGRYGPYSAEDIATVPLENAVALVAQGMAARVGAD